MRLKFKPMPELGGKNYRAENIKEVNPEYDGPVVAIELFYMTAAKVGPHSWGWTVMRVDANGNEYGQAGHSCHKFDALRTANSIVRDAHLLNYDECNPSTWKR
tara:strand:+ start:723 stop:1031 length:309 start_codon:yes stop_codon:yes gene_type:complete